METSYWYIPNALNKQEVIDLNNFIEHNYESIQPLHDGAKTEDGSFKKNFAPKSISYGKIKSNLEDVIDKLHTINQQAIGCDLYEMRNEDPILLNEYKTKKKYDWHIDGSSSNIFDVKLTALINMSTEPYSGGKFEVHFNNEQHVPELDTTGNLVVFRSHTLHRVRPITKGTRKSLTIFLTGPKWR